VLPEVGDRRHLPPVDGRVSQTGEPFVGAEFESDEVAIRTADDHFGAIDLHVRTLL
jgi:hypothetical protein